MELERRAQVVALESQVARQLEFCGMLGRSAGDAGSLQPDSAPRAARQGRAVSGETGTGKELAARAFHQAGTRRAQPFVTINCSAVVDTLFESELFGHVRGAFTGAVESKAGVFEAAQGGTLFLDEVGELPLSVQAKLLRALENGEVQRVGSLQPKRVDVAVIAATNRDLRAEVAAGRFRGDLFYRLNVVEVTLPPLRDRREDIPYLTAAFLRDCAQRMQQAAQRADAGGRAPAAARAVGRQRPRAEERDRARVHAGRTARCCRSASWPARSVPKRADAAGCRTRAPVTVRRAAARDAGAARRRSSASTLSTCCAR